jgi:2',3'-cyclic-nucleotide 2'-phosphodiesterase (5'-nucleotidase family)
MKRLFTTVFILLVLINPAFANRELTVIYINDTHGYVEPAVDSSGNSVGGFARIATVVEDIMADKENVLFLCGGDLLSGPAINILFTGKVDVECLNQMGLTACTLGNHEFDFGQDRLKELEALAEFPFISSNVWVSAENTTFTKDRYLSPYLPDFDLPIVIYGLTTTETPTSTDRQNVLGLEFLDPTAVSKKLLEYWGDEYPVIIALTHLGRENDDQLAQDVPGIDLIVGGHSHDAINPPDHVGDTVIVQAGEKGKYVGVIELKFDKTGRIEKYRSRLIPIDGSVAENPEVASIITTYTEQTKDYVSAVLGEALVAFDGEREHVRSQETNLGDLFADALRQKLSTDIAFFNGGSIRTSFPAGDITLGKLMEAFPYESHLVSIKLTGQQIKSALTQSLTTNKGEGGFLQVSGLQVTADSSGNILSVTCQGRTLDDTALYTIALPSFLAYGGDKCDIFTQGEDVVETDYLIRDCLQEYIQALGTLAEPIGGRIVIK